MDGSSGFIDHLAGTIIIFQYMFVHLILVKVETVSPKSQKNLLLFYTGTLLYKICVKNDVQALDVIEWQRLNEINPSCCTVPVPQIAHTYTHIIDLS